MRTVLLDADIVAYKVAALNEQRFDFGDTPCVSVDEAKMRRDCDDIVGEYCDTLDATRAVICLSDSERNFRKELNPTYKANRKGAPKPVLLDMAKYYLEHEYRSYRRPRLEADDCMGILATRPRLLGKDAGEVVMVSEDKDMRTVPGLLYNPNRPELGTIEVSELDADRFHLWQTIVGDPVDGYTGVPGLGPMCEWAQEIIGADRSDLWEIVTDAYHSKGLPDTAALMQARMAFILRDYAYNFETRKVRLWLPEWVDEKSGT